MATLPVTLAAAEQKQRSPVRPWWFLSFPGSARLHLGVETRRNRSLLATGGRAAAPASVPLPRAPRRKACCPVNHATRTRRGELSARSFCLGIRPPEIPAI